MTHLGDLVAALVDNELSHDGRDRALAHVAGCAQCRAEVDRQRRLKALLANQSDPQPSADLQTRLRAIADSSTTAGGLPIQPAAPQPAASLDRLVGRLPWSAEAADRRPGRFRLLLPATTAAFAPAAPTRTRPTGRAAAGVRPAGRRRTVRRVFAGSASALALTMALAAVGGATEPGAPGKVTPPVDRFLREHHETTARLPLGDSGASFAEVTFTR